MTGDALEITGGAAGLSADLDAMLAASTLLAEVSDDLARLALRVAGLAAQASASPTVVLDALGLARAEGELLPLLVGPASLPSAAARVALLARGVRTAARLYAEAETAAAAAVSQARGCVAQAAGAAVATSGPVTVAGAAAAVAGWAAYRAAPLALDEAERTLEEVAAGRFRWQSLDARLDDLGEAVLTQMRDDVGATSSEAGVWLARHPEAAEQLVQAGPPFLDGLTRVAWVPAVPASGGGDGSPGWPPQDVRQLTGAVAAVGAVAPLFVEGRVEVQRVEAGGPPVVPSQQGVTGALERLAPYSGPDAVSHPRVRVERVRRDGVTAWSVYIPPTQTWRFDGGPNPFDGSTNVRAAAGRTTAAGQAVRAALRRSGVKAGEPVMLAGYSQGGLTAVQLACDPAFRKEFSVTTVLSAGSPVAGFDLPADVQVLSLEHEQDLIPALDDGRNADRANWTTVRRDLGQEAVEDAFSGHRLDYYIQTAEAVDETVDPSVTAWRESARPFLATAGAQVEVVEWQARRLED
ncbi:MAG: hypothetical protein ACLGIA_07710 [Actinomycetes bacterium]